MTDAPPVLHLDLETRSTVDLPKSGPYVYAEHPTTDVWVACWAIDDEPVQAWGPGAPAPDRLRAHIEAGDYGPWHRAWIERYEAGGARAKG